MLDGKPLPSTACVWVREKGEGGRVAQSLVRGLLLPEDVHTFEDGMDELLGRQLQWHTIAVIPNTPFFLQSYINLFYPIHVYSSICYNCSIFVFVFITAGLSGCLTDPHPRWAGEGACQGCRTREGLEGCGGGYEQGKSENRCDHGEKGHCV